jgi:hypothetical protein
LSLTAPNDTNMPTFYLPPKPPLRPRQPDPNDVAGADVAFGSGMTIEAGDWKLVTKDAAAIQSVRRETVAGVGALSSRPEWGAGATDAVFRGITRSASDALLSRTRDRARKNPRVGKIIDVRLQRMTGIDGSALIVEFVPVGTTKAVPTVIGPRR